MSEVRLSDLGEDAVVERLAKALPRRPDVLVGAGDDCAVVERGDGSLQLLKTDCVIEGVHFLPDEDARRVGWKALARVVSDIAAMGGEPEHALVTVAAPAHFPMARLEALYEGLVRCAETYRIAIVGGETAKSPAHVPALFVSVALSGRVEPHELVLRSGGAPGDLLYVTGWLGGSLAGKHLDFIPRLAEARWLVAHCKPKAMMDLSDGLGADLPRLARASGCGFELNDTLPCNPGVSREAALNDGEDFELLFALAPEQANRLEKNWPFATVPVHCIGRLTVPGKTQPFEAHGFDHFAQR